MSVTTKAWLIRFLRARFRRPPRRALPTRAGLFVLGSPMVLGLAAVSSGNNLLFLLLGAVLAMIVVSGLLSEANLRGLSVRARLAGPAYAGEPTRIELELLAGPGWGGRRGPLSRHVLRFREVTHNRLIPWQPTAPWALDVCWPILEGQSARIVGLRTFAARGRGELLEGELSTEYPFALLHKVDDAEPELAVWVRPRRIPIPEALADLLGSAEEGELRERRGPGLEIYGLREREDRDAEGRIHALRSMALGRDVVLETSGVERPRAVLGLATLGADPEAFERALELAQAIVVAWDARGFSVCLVTSAEPRAIDGQPLEAILDRLSRLTPGPAADPKSGPGALWILPAGAQAIGEGRRLWVDARGEWRLE